MKKYGGIVLFAAVFLIAAMGIYTGHAKAAEKNITIYNGSNDANDWEDSDIYHVGDYGKIELQMDWYSMVEIARKEFHSSNEKTATVDAAGNFRIVGGGKTFITAKGWDAAGNECFSASYELFAAVKCQKPDCRQQQSKCIRRVGIMMTRDCRCGFRLWMHRI